MLMEAENGRRAGALAMAIGVLALVAAGMSPVAAAEVLVINTGHTPPVSTLFGRILAEAGRRLRLDIRFQELSAERAIALAADGIDDGDCCRIPAVVAEDYPSLVAVPEPVHTVEFVAFTRDPRIRIRQWEDLKPWSVATVTGWKITVKNMRRVQPKESYVVSTPEAMFRMLQADRIQVALLGRLSGLHAARAVGLRDLRVQEPPLARRELYLMLHRRHQARGPAFAEVFRQMRADGTLQRLVEQVMNEVPARAR